MPPNNKKKRKSINANFVKRKKVEEKEREKREKERKRREILTKHLAALQIEEECDDDEQDRRGICKEEVFNVICLMIDLVANRLNLKDGGKDVPLMKKTYYTKVGTNEVVQQSMQTANGVQKGVKTILEERELWDMLQGRKLLLCPNCRDGNPVGDNIYCCARRLLSEQADFKQQKEWLAETVEGAGHSIIFFPKFHCELNFIEMVWGYIKAKLRNEGLFQFQELLLRVVPLLKNEISISFVRKVSRHCFRYMTGYRLGLHGPELEFAMKKYKGHRRIPPDELQHIHEQLDLS